jgi:hypothetical protein
MIAEPDAEIYSGANETCPDIAEYQQFGTNGSGAVSASTEENVAIQIGQWSAWTAQVGSDDTSPYMHEVYTDDANFAFKAWGGG